MCVPSPPHKLGWISSGFQSTDNWISSLFFRNCTVGFNGDGTVSQSELNAVYANYITNSPWLLMTNVAGLGGTNVIFSLSNSPAQSFTVQMSADLVTWSNLGAAFPFYQFTDTNAPSQPMRYYRLTYP